MLTAWDHAQYLVKDLICKMKDQASFLLEMSVIITVINYSFLVKSV